MNSSTHSESFVCKNKEIKRESQVHKSGDIKKQGHSFISKNIKESVNNSHQKEEYVEEDLPFSKCQEA